MTRPRARLTPAQIGARSRDALARAAVAVVDPHGLRSADAVAANLGDVVECLDTLSLKALAWKYGCAAKGSDRERVLHAALLERAKGGGL